MRHRALYHGGHCQAGYWVDAGRRTSLPGLYAAGDVAGGYPYKFVSGCWAEGVIAARSVVADLSENKTQLEEISLSETELERIYRPLAQQANKERRIAPAEMEERLQKIMDEYAGGIGKYYEFNEAELQIGRKLLQRLSNQVNYLGAEDFHQLLNCHEVLDRIDVARQLVEHLSFRKETRWPGFQSHTDYPNRDDFNWLKFVNSRRDPETGVIEMIERPYKQIIPGERYLPR